MNVDQAASSAHVEPVQPGDVVEEIDAIAAKLLLGAAYAIFVAHIRVNRRFSLPS